MTSPMIGPMPAPTCDCDGCGGAPKLWHKDKREAAGGYWRCVTRHRSAQARYTKTPKSRETRARYAQTPKGRETQARYRQSLKGRATKGRNNARRVMHGRDIYLGTVPEPEQAAELNDEMRAFARAQKEAA